eukprot:scaffold5103_cov350-Prasinococcus_capsulatus_cf.AAC.4
MRPLSCSTVRGLEGAVLSRLALVRGHGRLFRAYRLLGVLGRLVHLAQFVADHLQFRLPQIALSADAVECILVHVGCFADRMQLSHLFLVRGLQAALPLGRLLAGYLGLDVLQVGHHVVHVVHGFRIVPLFLGLLQLTSNALVLLLALLLSPLRHLQALLQLAQLGLARVGQATLLLEPRVRRLKLVLEGADGGGVVRHQLGLDAAPGTLDGLRVAALGHLGAILRDALHDVEVVPKGRHLALLVVVYQHLALDAGLIDQQIGHHVVAAYQRGVHRREWVPWQMTLARCVGLLDHREVVREDIHLLEDAATPLQVRHAPPENLLVVQVVHDEAREVLAHGHLNGGGPLLVG